MARGSVPFLILCAAATFGGVRANLFTFFDIYAIVRRGVYLTGQTRFSMEDQSICIAALQ
jgi:hypothetical protein